MTGLGLAAEYLPGRDAARRPVRADYEEYAGIGAAFGWQCIRDMREDKALHGNVR